MKRLLFASALLAAAACGDKGRKATTPASDAAPAAVADAAPAADSVPAVVAPARTCTPARAATIGSCSDGLRCVLLLEVSATCTVKVANEIDIPDEALESDGGGIMDIAWPRKDGSLYLVNGVETWAWAELPSPLTAARDALKKVTWTPAKVGEIEPEGYQYGLTTDGQKAILVGCAKWDDGGGSGGEESEEWECKKTLFVDPHTKKKIAKAPKLPFMEPYDAKKCPGMHEPPDSMFVLSPTEWVALTTSPGSRMRAKWGVWPQYVKSCDDPEFVEGQLIVGPNQLWAQSTEAGWSLQHGPRGAALTDATGKVAAFGDGHFVWTSE